MTARRSRARLWYAVRHMRCTLTYGRDMFETPLPRSDLIVTSPPRVVAETRFLPLLRRCSAVLTSGGTLLVDVPPDLLPLALACSSSTPRLTCAGWHRVVDMYPGETQFTCVFRSGGAAPRRALPAFTVVRSAPMRHRCEFCPGFVRRLIERYSRRADVVLDPFCGTGTVPRVAAACGRIGYGMDRRNA